MPGFSLNRRPRRGIISDNGGTFLDANDTWASAAAVRTFHFRYNLVADSVKYFAMNRKSSRRILKVAIATGMPDFFAPSRGLPSST
jgi:hypothetical protein